MVAGLSQAWNYRICFASLSSRKIDMAKIS
jgi:hypothetical protein